MTEKKKNRLPVIIGSAAVVIVVIIVLALILSRCGGDPEPEETVTEQPTETITDTPVSESEIDDAVWNSTASGSGLPFELRIKPGTGLTIEEREDFSCTLASEDGKTVRIDLSGLYYETDFDQLIGFFKSKNPETISVGKNTSTVIVKYGPEKTEIVWKVTVSDCLSVTGNGADAIDAFIRNCTFRIGEEDYLPAELTDEFEEW